MQFSSKNFNAAPGSTPKLRAKGALFSKTIEYSENSTLNHCFAHTWKTWIKLVRDDFVLPERHSVTIGVSFTPALRQISVNISLFAHVHEPPIKRRQSDIALKQRFSNICNIKWNCILNSESNYLDTWWNALWSLTWHENHSVEDRRKGVDTPYLITRGLPLCEV